jgi:hypothetical protein
MGLSLATYTWGDTDAAYQWLLHSSGSDLATGIQLSLGDGTETALGLIAGGVRIKSAAGYQTLLLANNLANVTVDFGKLVPTRLPVTADVATTLTAGVAITDWGWTPEANSTYEVEMVIFLTTASTGTGAQFTVACASATTLRLGDATGFGIVAPGGTYAATSAVATTYQLVLKGILETGAGTPAALSVTLKSEVGGSAVTVLAKSWAKFTKV